MRILADLHNHSCLSPCASLEESPSLLARLGSERGLCLMALSDHNSALNCPAFGEACRRVSMAPIYGIEACSIEEVHVLTLFATCPEALAFGEFLRSKLLDLPYDPEKLGDEVVVDAEEGVLDLLAYYLGGALSLDFSQLCESAAEAGAIVIPAHVDRPAFSVSSQLGFLPPGPYDAVEAMRAVGPDLHGKALLISGSDAHYPEHVARRPFALDLPEELVSAVRDPGLAEEPLEAEKGLFEALRQALRKGPLLPSWAALS